MKRKRCSSLLMRMVIFIAFSLSYASLYGDDEWYLDNERDGVKIFVRNTSCSKIRECKGTMTLDDVSLSNLIALLDDTDSYSQWIHGCYEAKILAKTGMFERVTYLAHKFPFGLQDRDVVNRSILRQHPVTKEVRITFVGEPDFVQKVSGRIRMPVLKGYWNFKPLRGKTVEVEYLVFADPGGTLFSWMVNAGLSEAPLRTLLGMKKIVRQPKYTNAHYPEIMELQQY